MIPDDLLAEADALLAACRVKGITPATAESCTGGPIAVTSERDCFKLRPSHSNELLFENVIHVFRPISLRRSRSDGDRRCVRCR
jgi:hypothetical protein